MSKHDFKIKNTPTDVFPVELLNTIEDEKLALEKLGLENITVGEYKKYKPAIVMEMAFDRISKALDLNFKQNNNKYVSPNRDISKCEKIHYLEMILEVFYLKEYPTFINGFMGTIAGTTIQSLKDEAKQEIQDLLYFHNKLYSIKSGKEAKEYELKEKLGLPTRNNFSYTNWTADGIKLEEWIPHFTDDQIAALGLT